jgi:hypothetical protein
MPFVYRVLCLAGLLLIGRNALAAEETYLREYTYQASEADSKITARAIALQEVKRLLLSELGTHVSALVKIQSSTDGRTLGSEQIETLSAGVTRVDILAEKWDGSVYVLKAQIKADPADVLRSLEKMLDADKKQKQVAQLGSELDKMRGENLQMAESLTQSRRAADDAMAEIARLKVQLKQQQTDVRRQALQTRYQQQAQQLTLQELFDAGWKKYGEMDFFAAVALWHQAAEQGSAPAQLNLGKMYREGEGVAQDFKQAVFWTRKAAEQGLAPAQFNLGLLYFHGQGVPQDFQQVVLWIRKAAEQGETDAQLNLGVMYDRGQGVPQDFRQAIFWFRIAADQGNALAQFNLGVMYHEGKGVPQDFEQAEYWTRKAAEQGDAPAQFNLGRMYHEGEGVPQDFKQAVYWTSKAAEQGDADAQCALGFAYSEGQGVLQDYRRAVHWYDKAAKQGDASAQYILGLMYAQGKDGQRDFKQAAFWFRKAAEQGHEDAIKALQILEISGSHRTAP